MYFTHAIVLSRQDAGEHDMLFNLYTKEYGKVRAYAKGIKKEQAKLRGHLETLSLAEVGLVAGKTGERLIYSSLIHYWDAVRRAPALLEVGHLMAALVDEHCFAGTRDDTLWQLMVAGFADLEEGRVAPDAARAYADRFRARLFDCLGHADTKEALFAGGTTAV